MTGQSINDVSPEEESIWVDGLPEVIRERARASARERGISVEISGLVAITAVAACLGKGVVVRSGANRETSGNLFMLLGIPSGIGKSEIFRDLLGPVFRFDEELNQWWAQEAAPRARGGAELFKAAIAGIRVGVRKAGQPPLSVFKQLQALQLKVDLCAHFFHSPSLVADDATSEALAEMMYRSACCAAVVSPDARYILKRLEATGSKEESFFLKGFSGDISITSRISRRGIQLRSPCLTTILLTQPDAYRRFLSKTSQNRSGLLARFLHAEFYEDDGGAIPASWSEDSAIRIKYERLLWDLIETFRFENHPAKIQPNDDVYAFLKGIERDMRCKSATTESITGDVQRRFAEQVWRVALCLHAARHGKLAGGHPLAIEEAQTAFRMVRRMTLLGEGAG